MDHGHESSRHDASELCGSISSERLGRRTWLVLAALLGLSPKARSDDRSLGLDAAIDLPTFVSSAGDIAKELIGDVSRIGQDRYLHAIASWAARLRDVPIPHNMRETSKDSLAKTFLGANDADAPFTILHWRMEPDSRIGLHPHIYGNVVTLCLEGEVRIENYEMVGERDFDRKDPFPVRRVNDQMLLPGDLNLVSLEHGYVHGFYAGKQGARGLDITTRIKEKRSTPTLVVESEPTDAARRIYHGRWRE